MPIPMPKRECIVRAKRQPVARKVEPVVRLESSLIEKMKPYLKLADAAEKLMEIVEGVRIERWTGDRGQRLTDTIEWCAFYNAYTPIKYAKEDAMDFLLARRGKRKPNMDLTNKE